MAKNLFKNICKNANICIYGSNDIAGRIFDMTQNQRPDINIKFFVDSFKNGELKGLPIYSLKEFIDYHLNEVDSSIIASYEHRYDIKLILNSLGIKNLAMMSQSLFFDFLNQEQLNIDYKSTESVYSNSKDKKLFRFLVKLRSNPMKYWDEVRGYCKKHYPERYSNDMSIRHYFDFLNKSAIKTAIDAGGCDCSTSLAFVQEFPNLQKIYVFEPCYEHFKDPVFDILVQREKKIEIVNKALWSELTTLEFREEMTKKEGSAIIEAKPNVNRPSNILTLKTETIDNFVETRNIDKIDYIKMDIENAEMQALMGAENTLLKYRPQLAISIYHSDEQFYGIPVYLKKLLKNYQFRLAHYGNRKVDSMLYGIPKELITKNICVEK